LAIRGSEAAVLRIGHDAHAPGAGMSIPWTIEDGQCGDRLSERRAQSFVVADERVRSICALAPSRGQHREADGAVAEVVNAGVKRNHKNTQHWV
jgi:hypothetical protein